MTLWTTGRGSRSNPLLRLAFFIHRGHAAFFRTHGTDL